MIPTDAYSWYKSIRKHDPTRPAGTRYGAAWEAALHANRASEIQTLLGSIPPRRLAFIKGWFDEFIRSDDVTGLTSDRESDFINRRDRASRCYEAAEYGESGSTHAEIIGDWRDALSNGDDLSKHERIRDVVELLIERSELWHAYHGSLHG